MDMWPIHSDEEGWLSAKVITNEGALANDGSAIAFHTETFGCQALAGCSDIKDELCAKHTDIPWSRIARMRDRLVTTILALT